MDFVSKNKIKCFWSRQAFVLMMSVGVVSSLFLTKAGLAKGNETTQHFKMISSVEYTGQGQFKNRIAIYFKEAGFVGQQNAALSFKSQIAPKIFKRWNFVLERMYA